MRKLLAKLTHNWVAWLMGVVLVVSLLGWFATRVRVPDRIRIATGQQGGLYFNEGEKIVEAIEDHGRTAENIATSGSVENVEKLLDGDSGVDVAIVQAGAVPLHGLAIVTPLHRDVLHVLVRQELLDGSSGKPAVRSVADLAERNVIIGLPRSGMQASARDVLSHYNVTDQTFWVESHFTELLDDSDKQYAAAIVTTGIENGDLRRVLATGEFALLPLDSDALAKHYRHFESYTIPKNFWPPEPQKDIPSVATTAMVVVREQSDPELVTLLLETIFDEHLPEAFATLFSSHQVQQMNPARLHPVTRRYHDPFGQYGVMHTVLESLVAGKELLFALGAAIYLGWDRRRRVREKEQLQIKLDQKNRLDAYLDQTLEIERLQMNVFDPEQLQGYLDKVTEIKLKALDRLTHEDLRGDRTFSIFLMQCANLISKIQLKIITASSPE